MKSDINIAALISRIKAAGRFLDIHRPLFREMVTELQSYREVLAELRTLKQAMTLIVAALIIGTLLLSAHIIVNAVVDYNNGITTYTPRHYPPQIPVCDDPLWERITDRCK